MSEKIRSELRADVLKHSPDWCATKWVFEPTPFLFQGLESSVFWEWKSQLAKGLDVDSKNILVTGSAAVGVSLNPNKNMKPFNSDSDIDVGVISTYHFDLAWRSLRNLGTRFFRLGPAQKNALEQHAKNYIYWGTIATDKILSLLPFAGEWQEALSHNGKLYPTEDRDIKVRIYRDFSSLRAYTVLGFRSLRDQTSGLPESERILEES